MPSTPSSDFPFRLSFFFPLLVLFTFPLQSQEGLEGLFIPFTLQGSGRGEISVYLFPEKEPVPEEIFLATDEISAFLEPLLSDEGYLCLTERIAGRTLISLADLGRCELTGRFNLDTLTLELAVPPHLKREELLYVRGESREPQGRRLEPVPVAAWMESHTLLDYNYEEGLFGVEERLSGGVNLFSWVTEATVICSNQEEPVLLRKIRLTKDFPSLKSRLEAGDLGFSLRGLQGITSLTGVSFVRDFGLDPNRGHRPLGEYQFFLEYPAEVLVEVNGREIRRWILAAGTYRLENFGLASGVNTIRIFIIDGEGEREEILILPSDGSLLKEGTVDFGAAAGVPDRR